MTPGMLQQATQANEAARDKVDKLKAAKGQLDVLRKGLDRLSGMGDTVDTESVIEEAGHLVGAGIAPEQLAGTLAQAPQGGMALAGWLKQQDASVKQNEQGVDQALKVAQHQLGVSAMYVILGHKAQMRNASLNPAANALAQPTPSAPGETPGGQSLGGMSPQGSA